MTVDDAATIAEGFRWAADHGADVINCLGGTDFRDDPPSATRSRTRCRRTSSWSPAPATAADPESTIPGAYDGVITVSALTEQDQLTDASSYGPEVDLAAPG